MISDLSRLISPPPPCSPPSGAASASAGSSITHAVTMEPSHTERRWSIGQIPPVSYCRRRFVKTITRLRRLSIRPRDHAPADDEIVTVPHDRLTRRDRALGLVEHDLGTAPARRDDGRGRGTMAVADSRLHPQWLARPEEIGLVLARVAPATQEPAPARRIPRDARVMAGGHAGGVPGARPREQRAIF